MSVQEATRFAYGSSSLLYHITKTVFSIPAQIYAMFDPARKTRYHFLRYPLWYSIIYVIAGVSKGWLTNPQYGIGTTLFVIFFSALAISLLAWLEAKLAVSGVWGLSWYPGWGWRTQQGQFLPLFGKGAIGGGGAAMPAMSGNGAALAGETLLRGAAVVDGAALGQALKERATANGVNLAGLIELGGVPIDYKDEPKHFLIEGRTGSGKTQAINAMLRVVRKRGQAAIIADPAGGYLGRFYRQGDIVLNPFDARNVAWSPFAEIEADYDCQRIAKAAIPDAHGDSQEWHFYAQSLLGETMLAMHKRKDARVKELLRYVMAADSKELGDLLAGTSAAILTQRGNEKMLSNTRAIMSLYLSAWQYLPDTGDFSVRAWVRNSDKHPAWLYLTYRDDQMAMLKNLVSCWLELAIVEGLTLTENNQRRLWYIMDELDSLGKISSLRAGLTKLRKYGGVCVSGLQTVAQIRTTYGREEAQTLLSCMSTKLILAAGDSETAKYCEDELGQQETEREETSSGNSQRFGELGSASENTSKRQEKRAAVMYSQIQGLPDLHGYLKLIGLPTGKIVLPYVGMPDVAAPFEARKS